MLSENPLVPENNNDFNKQEIIDELVPPVLTFDIPENEHPGSFKNSPLSKTERIIRTVTLLHKEYTFNAFDNTNRYPPVGDLIRRVPCSMTELNEIIPNINASLVKRGYEPYIYEYEVHGRPLGPSDIDPFFIIAVDLICDITDKRSKTVKLKQADITSLRFNTLMKDKKHYDYWKKRWEDQRKLIRDAAEVSIAKNVEAGDLQSIKFFYEVEDIYRPETGINNLGIIIAQLMEVLVQFLNPKDLVSVAEKFEGVISANSRELTRSN